MADGVFDEVEFSMVNGDKIRKQVPAGQGIEELANVGDGSWISIDNNQRIQTDKIVSVTVHPNVHESPQVASL